MNPAPARAAIPPRGDWAWLALVLVAAVVARADEVRHAAVLIDADCALGALMGQRIWREAAHGYLPLMLDGQDYLGSLEAFFYAPFNALAPLATAMGAAETVLVCAILVLLHAMLRTVVGRAAALAGVLTVAVATPVATEFTAVAPMGYVSNLAIGLGLVFVAHRYAAAPVPPRRLAVLGLLLGIGYWNSPQVAPYALAAVLALVPRSAVFAASRRGELFETASQRGAAALALGGALALGATLALQLGGPTEVLGLSLSRPDRYSPRAAVALALALLLFDLACARERARWLAGLSAALAGGVMGAAPLLAYKAFWPPTGIVPTLQFRLAEVVPNLPIVGGKATEMLVGPPAWGDGLVAFPGYGAWRIAVVASLSLALALLLATGWRDVLALARLRAERVPLPLLLVVPAAVTLLQLLLRGGIQWSRYFVVLLPVAAVAVAMGVHALVVRGWRRVAFAWVALLVSGYVLQQVDRAERLARRDPVEARLVESLRRDGLVHGYGQYWTCYRLNAIADGALFLDCNYDGGDNYHRFPHNALAIARHPGDLVRLYDLGREDREDGALLALFLDGGDRAGWGTVTERRAWNGGRYVALRYARRAGVR